MKIDFGRGPPRDDGTVELNKGRRIISEELFQGLLRLLSVAIDFERCIFGCRHRWDELYKNCHLILKFKNLAPLSFDLR